MKLIIALGLALLMFSGCAGKSPRRSGGAQTAAPPTPNPDREIVLLNARDIAMLEAGTRLQERIGDSVWPGFSKFKTAVVMMTDHGQVLMNATTAPEYYRRYRGKVPYWGGGAVFVYEPMGPDGEPLLPNESRKETIASAFSSEQTGQHYMESVFFVDTLQRFHSKGMKWTIDEWLSVFWHEVFHNLQTKEYRHDLAGEESYDFSKIQPLLTDAEYLTMVRAEQKLVTDALKEKSSELKRNLICEKILPSRAARFRKARAKAVEGAAKAEVFYEASEGTARYVEEMMSLAAGRLKDAEIVQLSLGLEGFPNFTRFAKFKTSSLDQLYVRVGHIGPKDRYYYQTGFALSLLMDQVDPDWKTRIFKTPNFFAGLLHDYCRPAGAMSPSRGSSAPRTLKLGPKPRSTPAR